MASRNEAALYRTRICNFYAQLTPPWNCSKGANCFFAHSLKELSVPNEGKNQRWWGVWER